MAHTDPALQGVPYLHLCKNVSPPIGKKRWHDFSATAKRSTETLRILTLRHLGSKTPKKVQSCRNPVHVVGGIILPEKVRHVLHLGPKFAVESMKLAPELLSFVRVVSRRAPEAESDRCISGGIDLLARYRQQVKPIPIQRVDAYFKEK